MSKEINVNQEGQGLPYSAIEAQIKFLQGQILTIIEASHPDKEQRKALKDLVNNAVRDKLVYVYNLTHTGSQLVGMNATDPRGEHWDMEQSVQNGNSVM